MKEKNSEELIASYDQKCRIIPAKETDREELLSLYHSMIGGRADWNENYPGTETIDFDLSRNALYVMKNENEEIISCISIDEDEEVEKLPCWSGELQPSGEVSRLCVRKDMQNKGIARQMMRYTFDILEKRGMKSVHILVRPEHTIAIRSYSHLDFVKVGECELFGKSFLCFEKKLG